MSFSWCLFVCFPSVHQLSPHSKGYSELRGGGGRRREGGKEGGGGREGGRREGRQEEERKKKEVEMKYH